MNLTIRNYRCFPESDPARIAVEPGFTALPGPNNSGKSALLRFFYKFRELFRWLSMDNALWSATASNNTIGFARQRSYEYGEHLFSPE